MFFTLLTCRVWTEPREQQSKSEPAEGLQKVFRTWVFCNQSSLPYDRFAKELGISIAGEKLDCRDMQSFSAQVSNAKDISSPIPRGRPTRLSTGRQSRVAVW